MPTGGLTHSPSSSWNTTSKFLLQSDTEKFLVAFRDLWGKKIHNNWEKN